MRAAGRRLLGWGNATAPKMSFAPGCPPAPWPGSSRAAPVSPRPHWGCRVPAGRRAAHRVVGGAQPPPGGASSSALLPPAQLQLRLGLHPFPPSASSFPSRLLWKAVGEKSACSMIACIPVIALYWCFFCMSPSKGKLPMWQRNYPPWALRAE